MLYNDVLMALVFHTYSGPIST